MIVFHWIQIFVKPSDWTEVAYLLHLTMNTNNQNVKTFNFVHNQRNGRAFSITYET